MALLVIIHCFRYKGDLVLNVGSLDAAQNLTIALRDLYEAMDKSATIAPLILLQVLHMAFPRFAEKGEGGAYCQQDANECWTELVRMLQQKLRINDTLWRDKELNRSVLQRYFRCGDEVHRM